ncbi:hypothetical protein DFS33DRAFT_1254493, partial [Desarmillaria ectypa]
YSGYEARTTKSPPGYAPDRMAIGAHTDFGSLSFLQNRLGGLQVLPQGYTEWRYVKVSPHAPLLEPPLVKWPKYAICNAGDALLLLSGGILRSNLHRVLQPSGPQSDVKRWSMVFFTTRGNSKILHALVENSPLIAEAVRYTPEKSFETSQTAVVCTAGQVSKIKRQSGRCYLFLCSY